MKINTFEVTLRYLNLGYNVERIFRIKADSFADAESETKRTHPGEEFIITNIRLI